MEQNLIFWEHNPKPKLVMYYMCTIIFRYFETHGPVLDERDFKTIDSPLYDCLKFDINRKSSQKMLELTKYGKEFLEKQGLFLKKTGDPVKNPGKSSSVPRAKHLNFEEEITKADDQDLQRFGAKIEEMTQKYYTEPAGLTSKRSKKMAKNVLQNYDEKANLGYMVGDRLLFANLSNDIGKIFIHPDQRPAREMIFRRLMRVMDKKPDRPGPISENSW